MEHAPYAIIIMHQLVIAFCFVQLLGKHGKKLLFGDVLNRIVMLLLLTMYYICRSASIKMILSYLLLRVGPFGMKFVRKNMILPAKEIILEWIAFMQC